MSSRTKSERDSVRRSGAVVESINNLTGPVTIVSPMLTLPGSNVIRLDNGNSKTLGAAPTSADINTDNNTAFLVAKISAGVTVLPSPAVPSGNVEDRRITFTIISRGNPADTFVFTTGVGAFTWANPASNVGPTEADFNSLLAQAPNDAVIKVGAAYSSTINKWCIVALAGYYP